MATVTTTELTVRCQIGRFEIVVDMHQQHYRVVRQLDRTLPEPAQKHEPAAFLAWLKKQRTLAGEVVVCYGAGCFG